jgi:hypothetical protein
VDWDRARLAVVTYAFPPGNTFGSAGSNFCVRRVYYKVERRVAPSVLFNLILRGCKVRKNFDYVEMSDYKSDMDDLGQTSAAVVHKLDKDRRHWERMFWAAVISAGGSIKINNSVFCRLGDLEGLQWEGRSSPMDDAMEFHASFIKDQKTSSEEPKATPASTSVA